jgi:L,D-transpeptidase-like protein
MNRTRLIAATTLALFLGLPAGYAAPAATASSPAPAGLHLAAIAGGPAREVLQAALAAYGRAQRMGAVGKTGLLTIIDYSRPSIEPRLWVIDLQTGRSIYHELVAHGRGSGDNIATAFSNEADSHMSSLGLFVTGDPYVGKNGYSLRLQGLDHGLNDHALARAIVVHGAPYVSEDVGRKLGRIGRSWGCPAVPLPVAHALIDTIKGGSVVFAYGPGTGERRVS